METALVIAGVGALILLLAYGNLVRVARGLRLRRGTCLLKDPGDLPVYFGRLREPVEGELARLGFRFSHVQLDESPFVGPVARKWVLVYLNPTAGASAEVALADAPEPARPFVVTFVTYFSGRHRLMTVNGIGHGIVGALPYTTLVDPCVVDLAAQWDAHRKAAAGLASRGTTVMLPPKDYVRVANELLGAYIHALKGQGWVYPAGEGLFRLRLRACLRVAVRLLRGSGKHKALLKGSRKKFRKQGKTIEIPIEVEVESYRRTAHLQKGHGMGWAGKLALLVATMIFFALSFGIGGSWASALLITAVILLHEGGHYLGMRLYRYEDVKVLFLPFMGAVTVGRQLRTPLHQRVIVLLLGPVPGIVAGTALLLSPVSSVPWVGQLAVLLLAVNYLNLLPVMPLDGGQMFNLLISRLPLAQALFQGGCGMALLAMSMVKGENRFLYYLGMMVVIGAVMQLKYRGLINGLARKLPKGSAPLSEDGLLALVFKVLRERGYHDKPFRERFQAATHLMQNVPAAAPSLKLVLGATFAYLAVFVIPAGLVVTRAYFGSGMNAMGSLWQKGSPGGGAAATRIFSMKPDSTIRLTPEEEALATTVAVDREILVRLKQLTGGAITPLAGEGAGSEPPAFAGLSMAVPGGLGGILVNRMGKELAPQGYLLFVDQSNFGKGDDLVGLIRSDDSFDILRLKKTDGINRGHTSDDVLARLQDWHKRYPLTITGAGRDWVEIELREVPADPRSFAEEVYRFCPDTVDQGARDVGKLAESIAESRHVFLWWD